MITEATVKEWQSIIKRDFATELSLEEARQNLTDYVSFLSLLSEINHRDNSDGALGETS